MHPTERVMIVGLDGATYDVLTPFAELGLMPNLAALMGRSALATLRSTSPAVTPVAWATLLTGVDPARHRVFDYRYFDRQTRQVLLNNTARIGVPTIFDHLAARGESVVSIGTPMTYPAPRVNGIVVGGLDSPSSRAALASCPPFAARLRAAGIELSLDTVWRRRPASLDEVQRQVARTAQSFDRQTQAARVADEMTDWRLMIVQYQALDSLQHRCWHLLGLDGQAGATHAWVEEVRRAYTALDQCLGQLIELADRRGAALMVVSDHGFGPYREKISVREVLRRAGLLAPASLAQRAGYRWSRSAWKIRRAMSRLVLGNHPRAMSRPLGALDAIDWNQSRAVALHGSMAGLVYLNTPGRFGSGPVVNERIHEETLAQTLAAFGDARHPETGESLFADVFAVRSQIEADPVERGLPDVVAVPAPGFHTRSKPDRHARLMPADAGMTGTHRAEGMLMVAGSGVTLGQSHTAEMRDIAPTVLALLGIDAARMDGRVLRGLWTASALPAMPERLIAPDQASVIRPAANRADDAVMSVAEQRGVENRLRELGYIE